MNHPSPMPPPAADRHRQPVIDRTGRAGIDPTEPNLRYAWHALHRMASLGFTRDDVRATISDPLWTRPNGRAHPQNRKVMVGPTLLVVWQPTTNTVITVLLRTSEPFHHGQHNRRNLPTAA